MGVFFAFFMPYNFFINSIINLTKGYKKMALSKKHYKKIAELIGKHTVKPNLKTETNVNFIAYGFVWDLAKYFIEDSKKKPEGFKFKPETFYDAINRESINADFDAINKSMIKINLNNVTESEDK